MTKRYCDACQTIITEPPLVSGSQREFRSAKEGVVVVKIVSLLTPGAPSNDLCLKCFVKLLSEGDIAKLDRE